MKDKYNSNRIILTNKSSSTNTFNSKVNDYPFIKQAFDIIINELNVKDKRITELEEEINYLKLQIRVLSSGVPNKINNYINSNITQNDLHSLSYTAGNKVFNNINSDLISKQFGDINSGTNSSNQEHHNFNFNNNTNNNDKIMFNYNSNNDINKIQYDSDNEKIINFSKKSSFISNNNSQIKNQGRSNSKSQSKSEVKNFLKEVKAKVSSETFKEFIGYIKLLTSKTTSKSNRNETINKVKILFGEKHNSLFKRFERILGLNKSI